MKKIFSLIAIAALAIIYSCSGENDAIMNDGTSHVNTKALYTEQQAIGHFNSLQQSTSWLGFNTSIRSLSAKMNGRNFTFIKKTDFVTWVTANLSSTGFTSIAQASSMFDDSQNRLNVIIQNNKPLFDYYQTILPSRLPVITKPVNPGPPVVYPTQNLNACQEGCIATHSAGIIAAQGHLDDVWTSLNNSDTSLFGTYIAMWVARNNYNDTEVTLQYAYNSCMGGCGS